MPNLDAQTLLSDQQSIATTVGTVVSTNTIDLGAAATDNMGNTLISDVGRSNGVQLLVQIVTTVTSGGAATVQAQIITSASADLSTPTVIQSSAAIALATLVAGYQFRLDIPIGIAQRYFGVQYVVGGATTTAGKVTAGIVGALPTSFVG